MFSNSLLRLNSISSDSLELCSLLTSNLFKKFDESREESDVLFKETGENKDA